MIVCHALTGNQAVHSWWKEIFGKDKLLDPTKYKIVCANVLGSCYGTTGPSSIDRTTRLPYGSEFPETTIRDTVRLHMKLIKEELKVKHIACVIGGSMGGMQALEWAAIGGPELVRTVVPICCGTHHHAWQIAVSETQRRAIRNDPNWYGGDYYQKCVAPNQGLALARQIAMISYRSHEAYEKKFGRHKGNDGTFEVERYLTHQGRKFLPRFDASSYVHLTQVMDSHDLGRNRHEGIVEFAAKRMTMPALVVGVSSDGLYPTSEQEALHRVLPNSEYLCVDSPNGHDGFLLDHEAIMPVAMEFLRRHVPIEQRSIEGGGTAKL